MYDFACSAFSSTVVTLFLGPYLTALARAAADARGFVHPLGVQVAAQSYWSYLIALSVLTQVLVLPPLGALADSSRYKKLLFGVFSYLGAGASIAMFALTDGMYLVGGALFLVANLAFGASTVLYNSYLNVIAEESERDAVSAKGWGIGYLGGAILLAGNLALVKYAPALGMTEAQAVRISLGSAGAWWALFAMIPMIGLRSRPPARPDASIRELFTALGELRHQRQTLLFLIAYLLYNDAVQAVLSLAGQFGSDYLKISLENLTLVILLVQFVAFGGALLFNLVAKIWSGYVGVLISLVVWIVLMSCVFLVKTTFQFFMAAAAVAIVMGGSQALSRSLYSIFIPAGREAAYFSIYEVSDKGTSWMAPLVFGLTLQFSGSYPWAVISLTGFFITGFIVLLAMGAPRGETQ
jgi:UMF1 family MFS transporter